ncbi:hypothetical protein HGRIS_009316 [Hohenbuehelia grisea]|uniref:Velvet domain-containing protein n=1 Tax=Hohenbuehelia grisea TaxID=104357 RepID=A0ABR3J132_9AGAR
MIQKTNPRHPGATVGPMQPPPPTDGPETWGQWVGRKQYSLEIVQHPLRARMCGFGDKDRRPLAPAAVAKMIVKREDNSLVDVDEVDCSFFLVTVDLWSGDGKHEMNLVLHPSSADRYVPTQPKPRRRGTSTSAAPQSSGHQSPPRSTPTPQFPNRMRETQQQPPPPSTVAPIMPPQAPGYSAPGSYFPAQPPPIPEAMGYQQAGPYGPAPAEGNPTWGYPQTSSVDRNATYPPPVLPSIHSFGRSPASGGVGNTGGPDGWQQPESATREDSEMLPYRPWPMDNAMQMDQHAAQGVYNNPPVDPSLRTSNSSDTNENSSGTNHRTLGSGSGESLNANAASAATDHSMYASASYAQHTSQPQYYPGQYAAGAPGSTQPPPSSALPPLPRHTYTRTLVGPLSANACRLLDEHRKPGIFFLFQDLSVRTEGSFRLRLRLMNVGAHPAPDAGAVRVHNDVSPVLAQTFTDAFMVYSAKRFPGVPDTTALSIAFGNQGQKLPLRNRHGSNKQGRRRRGDSGSEDDDSEGA